MTSDLEVTGREEIADWIEVTLLARGTRQLGIDQLLHIADVELELGDAQLSLGLRTMSIRKTILGNAYPFDVLDVAVRAHTSAMQSSYAFLVLLSSGSVARQLLYPVPTSAMDQMFEDLTAIALSCLWGDDGEALSFGWPSRNGRPPNFGDAIGWLTKKMGIPTPKGYRPPSRKDGGVDVVAWRSFADHRQGFPIVLAQCTLQSDLLSKTAEIETRVWGSWLGIDVDPMAALCVPQTIAVGELWNQLTLRCVVFERLRLVDLLRSANMSPDHVKWSTDTLASLKQMLMGSQD